MKRVFLLIALTSLLQGCRSTPTAVDRAITPIGRWSIPMVSSDTEYCGIELLEDGRARSINLITLHYEEWKQRGDTLVLSGRSIVDASMVCMAAGRSPGFFYAEIMDVFYFEMALGNVLY